MRPSNASSERAAIISAFFESLRALSNAKTPLALMNWVPFSKASPSLLINLTGSQPNSSSTLMASRFIINIANSNQRQKEVGQRRQITRSPQGSAIVDNRHYVVIEKVENALYGDDLYPAVTQGKSMGFKQQHQLDNDRA